MREHKTSAKRRSALQIMGSLIGLVKPLLHIMLIAVVLGTAGYLCAIFLTILAGQVILQGLLTGPVDAGFAVKNTWLMNTPVKTILVVMIVIAVLRGLLHYVEQYCNHFIAFKLLAIIRHKVFAALRRLCPAKLEGRDKGNLISVITTDIELLEVFYAHTISPIAIAILTSLIMVIFIGGYHPLAGLVALASYLVVGVVIPIRNGKCGGETGMAFRTEFGELNSFVLDSLRGLDETIQYGQGEKRMAEMSERSRALSGMQEELSRREGTQRAVTNMAILLSSFAMLAFTIGLYEKGQIGFEGVLTCTIAMMGSFGPTAALSSLSNNLNQTLASGERVLSILEEMPLVEEIPEKNPEKIPERISERIPKEDLEKNSGDAFKSAGSAAAEDMPHRFAGARAEQVTFSYAAVSDGVGARVFAESSDGMAADSNVQNVILNDYSVAIQPGRITGIHGASGSGKSTLLKLLMRFWDVQDGEILVDGENVKTIPTSHLRSMESYVTQETHLFHDSIANNIAIAKPDASREEIIRAAQKASIHDFIMTLPKGYDTEVGELGDTLSGGEKQRIGIARAFLHDAPMILLDEPTSNLDSLNEGIILKSLRESAKEQTVVLVSHRTSTMKVADVVYEMQ